MDMKFTIMGHSFSVTATEGLTDAVDGIHLCKLERFDSKHKVWRCSFHRGWYFDPNMDAKQLDEELVRINKDVEQTASACASSDDKDVLLILSCPDYHMTVNVYDAEYLLRDRNTHMLRVPHVIRNHLRHEANEMMKKIAKMSSDYPVRGDD